MGAAFPCLSAHCLPLPTSEKLFQTLQEHKIVFYAPQKPRAQDQKKTALTLESFRDLTAAKRTENQMVEVDLPTGFGLFLSESQGEMEKGYLLDDRAAVLATLWWYSQGTHDHECRISEPTEPGITLNTDAVEYDAKEQIWSRKRLPLNELVQTMNAYYRYQYELAVQEELDADWEQVKKLYSTVAPTANDCKVTGLPATPPRLMARELGGPAVANAHAIAFREPFSETGPVSCLRQAPASAASPSV